jgi:hypothetical protein
MNRDEARQKYDEKYGITVDDEAWNEIESGIMSAHGLENLDAFDWSSWVDSLVAPPGVEEAAPAEPEPEQAAAEAEAVTLESLMAQINALGEKVTTLETDNADLRKQRVEVMASAQTAAHRAMLQSLRFTVDGNPHRLAQSGVEIIASAYRAATVEEAMESIVQHLIDNNGGFCIRSAGEIAASGHVTASAGAVTSSEVPELVDLDLPDEDKAALRKIMSDDGCDFATARKKYGRQQSGLKV